MSPKLREAFNLLSFPITFLATHEFLDMANLSEHAGYIQDYISTGMRAYAVGVISKYTLNAIPPAKFIENLKDNKNSLSGLLISGGVSFYQECIDMGQTGVFDIHDMSWAVFALMLFHHINKDNFTDGMKMMERIKDILPKRLQTLDYA